MKRFVMEFLGTAFFLFTLCAVVPLNLFFVSSMLLAWVCVGYAISGAHYNPFVSWLMYLRGQLNLKDLRGYMLAQVLGGFVGVMVASLFNLNLNAGGASAISYNILSNTAFNFLNFFALFMVIFYVGLGKKFKDDYVYKFVVVFSLVAYATQNYSGLFNPASVLPLVVLQANKLQFVAYGLGLVAAYLFAKFAHKYFFGEASKA